MWEPVALANGNGSSTIGWFIRPFTGQSVIIAKNGGSASWSARVQFVPDLRLGVVALTNVGGPIQKDVPMSELVQIENAVLDAVAPFLGSNPSAPRTSLVVRIAAADPFLAAAALTSALRLARP